MELPEVAREPSTVEVKFGKRRRHIQIDDRGAAEPNQEGTRMLSAKNGVITPLQIIAVAIELVRGFGSIV